MATMREDGESTVRWAAKHVLALKVCVAVGLLSTHLLPAEWATAATVASAGANMLWLWKL